MEQHFSHMNKGIQKWEQKEIILIENQGAADE